MAAEAAYGSTWGHVRDLLPEGMELPRATWQARHRFILFVIAGHALALPLFGFYRGWGPAYSLGEGLLIALLGVPAAYAGLSRRARAAFASLALVTSSAVLVQFSGGFIEAHFHYFIVVALAALYQDWAPFLLAILYVAVDHGVVGTLQPEWVFNHEAGHQEPWKWALIHAVAILGECVALLAFWSGAEEASARSDIVLESAGEGVVGLDQEGRITFANPAAGAILGRREDELVGKEFRHYVPSIAQAMATPRAGPREDLLTSSDGSQIPVEWTFTPTVRTGTAIGAVVILRDISERHAMEEQLRQHRLNLETMVQRRTAQLLEANRELEAFSYTVSHDLRSPLRSIDGFSRILLAKHGKDLPQEARAMLGMLGDGAIRMGNLIESILALSRLSRVELANGPVDLSAMAQAILRELQAKEPDRHVEWEVAPGLRATGDAGLLRLALENLLQNAWKFTGAKATARISVRAADTRDGRAFVVADDGAGFDMALADELFQPFHRLHTPSEFEGTGIGLATVNRIVRRHGGRIWAEAEVGRGARFYFTVGTPAATAGPTDGVMHPKPAAPPMVSLANPKPTPPTASARSDPSAVPMGTTP
ncbi:MAG TPA: ATP-binding protein [Candidatus Thermoplasmatota archaeon]|nr:ATP-binding protein [Candidatus Thermoplasmatota archaeon]